MPLTETGELECATCGWRVPDPHPLFGAWNAWDQKCIRREADGSYTLFCPLDGGTVLAGIRYQAEMPPSMRQGLG